MTRARSWRAICRSDPTRWRTTLAQTEASAFQETYLRQVRALLWDLDRFRLMRCTRKERENWGEVLKGWVVWRASSRPGGLAPCASTILRWVWAVNPRLPKPCPPAALAALLRGVATMSLLRPDDRVRTTPPEITDLLADAWRESRCPTSRAIFVTIAFMANGGMRRSDAVRITCGDVNAWEPLDDHGFVIFPNTEKTDMTGSREIEPFVFVCEESWLPVVGKVLSSPYRGGGRPRDPGLRLHPLQRNSGCSSSASLRRTDLGGSERGREDASS